MSGSGNMVGGGVGATGDGRGVFLPVETGCPGTVHGVLGGDGARVDEIPYIDAEWEGNRRDT